MQPFVKKRNILCVDDEKDNLVFLTKLLQTENYNVITTPDPIQAMDIIQHDKIDVILLDVMMAPINGFEVCRMIKEDPENRNIPVIMLTALSSIDQRVKGIEAGAEDFISKPFDVTEVFARIKMLLKVKDLNSQLNSAYSNVTNLIYIGEKLIRKYNPHDFDFTRDLEMMITESILKKKEKDAEKPQVVLIGLPAENNVWEWVCFRFSPDGPRKEVVHFDKRHFSVLSDRRESRIFFFNSGDDLEADDRSLLEDLGMIEPDLKNAVCSLSGDFRIFCLNYGKTVSKYDAEVLESFAMQILYLNSLSFQFRQTESAFTYTVFALARAAEAMDTDTGEHIVRVGCFCALIAEILGLPEKTIKNLRVQAALHDVGKTHIPVSILRKPGVLTSEEWEEMKKHTIYGARIIGDHPMLAMGRKIALYHHEKWDGSGYPEGRSGEAIPLESRIMNIIDQYDALRSARPYKCAFDHETAYRIITEGDGRTMPFHFDPRVLDAFKKAGPELAQLFKQHSFPEK